MLLLAASFLTPLDSEGVPQYTIDFNQLYKRFDSVESAVPSLATFLDRAKIASYTVVTSLVVSFLLFNGVYPLGVFKNGSPLTLLYVVDPLEIDSSAVGTIITG